MHPVDEQRFHNLVGADLKALPVLSLRNLRELFTFAGKNERNHDH